METSEIFTMFKFCEKRLYRTGNLKTQHGVISTPFFLPIATKGAVKTISSEDLKQLGAPVVLSNTYHLMLQPGISVIKKAGGLHQFMNWNKPILTDSGGFQVFSLAKIRKVTNRGVEFRSPIDGTKHLLTPEKAIQIQIDLGSDIMMVLDDVIGYPATKKQVEEAMKRTLAWAERCLKYKKKKRSKSLLFAIIQGGVYKDLRLFCLEQLVKMDFDGYAIGGLSVGEPESKMFQVLDWVLPLLPENKPRYLMGVGRPEQIVKAVKLGVDMFDCVIPTREGRHGRLYQNFKFQISNFKLIQNDWSKRKKLFYQVINIKSSRYRADFSVINKKSKVPELRQYTKAYLNHLFKTEEPLGQRLASLNNLEFYLEVMSALRKDQSVDRR